MTVSPELPVLKALVLADHVYTDRESGKRVIAGTFNRLFSQEFPHNFSRPTWAFILLDDAAGEVHLLLRFVRLSDNDIVMESPTFSLQNKDRHVTVDLAIEIPRFYLPTAGVYSLECHVNQSIIGSVRIEVIQTPGQEDSDAND